MLLLCGGYNTKDMENNVELIDFLTEIFNDSEVKPSLRFTANKLLTSINTEPKEPNEEKNICLRQGNCFEKKTEKGKLICIWERYKECKDSEFYNKK